MRPQQMDGVIWAVGAKRLCVVWRATADCLSGHEVEAAADAYRQAARDLEREAGRFLRNAHAFDVLHEALCLAVRETIRAEAQRTRDSRNGHKAT